MNKPIDSTRVTQVIISSSLQFEIWHRLPIAGAREMIDVDLWQDGKFSHHAFASRKAAILFLDDIICQQPEGEKTTQITHINAFSACIACWI